MIEIAENGCISSCTIGGRNIAFMDDVYSGFQFVTKIHQRESHIALHREGKSYYGEYRGILYSLSYEEKADGFRVRAHIENRTPVIFMPEWVALRTGISHYMESWPQWDSILYPTLLRCEKDGFYGYYSSPDGMVLAFSSPDPVAAWKNCYDRIEEEDEGDYCLTFLDGGHRIHTSDFHLMNRKLDNDRYPVCAVLRPGEEKSWTFDFTLLGSREELPEYFAEGSRMPFIRCPVYSAGNGGSVKGTVHSRSGIRQAVIEHDGSGEKRNVEVSSDGAFETPPLVKSGTYTMTVTDESGRRGQARLFSQRNGLWYLDRAMDAVLENPPCPVHHMECFVSLYTLLYGEIHLGRREGKAHEIFDHIIDNLYDKDRGEVRYAAHMRIQDTACMGAILALKYTVSKDPKYLEYASNLADFLVGCQKEDGAYYAQRTATKLCHYTCCTYIAVYMMDIADVEASVPGYAEKSRKHLGSAYAACADIMKLKDRIGTEGEITFDDGTVSCALHQLTVWAGRVGDTELRNEIIDVSEKLYHKHLCLDQEYVPDCRMNGATLRFWEAQYNLSIFSNMFNSPCGWSAWKLYGAWNLYRLTGKKEYFYMSLNCIRACIELIDDETGKLRWGFTPDPYVITEAFVPDNGGEVETVRISEQYLEMTSTWHRTVPFPRPKWGIDNLVHEIFKAYSEIYLPHAVVLEDDGLVCMNCRAERGGDGAIRIRNIGPCVKTVIVDLDREESVIIDGVPHAMRKGEISMGGQTP